MAPYKNDCGQKEIWTKQRRIKNAPCGKKSNPNNVRKRMHLMRKIVRRRSTYETTMSILNVAAGTGSIWEATMASLNVATGRGSIWESRVAQITETMRLFAGSVGVANSMQYLVLLPGLALVHRGELFTYDRLCDPQFWFWSCAHKGIYNLWTVLDFPDADTTQ